MSENAKRDHVLREAIEIFGDRGYRATSMREVSLHVGLSKSALYHYFAGKEELLVEIYKRVIEENIAAAQRMTESADRPVAALRQMLYDRVVYTCENRRILAVFHEEENELPDRLMEQVRASRRDYQALIVELLRRAVDDGDVVIEGSASVVANTMLGACNWSYKWYRPDAELSPEDLAGQISAVLLNGVLTAQGRGGRRRAAASSRAT